MKRRGQRLQIRRSSHLRQDIIRSRAPGYLQYAAIEIQRFWRGHRVRVFRRRSLISTAAVYGGSKEFLERVRDLLSEPVKTEAALMLEDRYSDYVTDMMNKRVDVEYIMNFRHFAAQFIQNWWLAAWTSRLKRSGQWPQKRAMVLTLSKQRRGYARIPLTYHDAAIKIQHLWRRHIDMEVYRYYRDLINFHTCGDPSLMLRCINPNEAKLLDSASGIHVKFRLAGDVFPPNIYYKIYTHRNIVDMCANSPKDYTRERQASQREVNTNHFNTPTKDKCGWYQRIENNGWRLVSDRLISHAMCDSTTFRTSLKPVEFHHSKLKRKQDVEQKKKRQKIEWMKKMYSEGMLYPKSNDPDTAKLVDGVTAGMVSVIDRHGPDTVDEWEVDQLLEWTTGLNYDDYVFNWKGLATSSTSERSVDDRLHLMPNTMDPYEFTVSMGDWSHSRYQSVLTSHGPASRAQSSAVYAN